MKFNLIKHVLPAVTILAAVVAMPAQASYVCTGVAFAADPSTPYFDGNLTDARCDITEVEAALGLTPGTIDETLIVGSKTNSNEDIVSGDIISWTQDEFDLGTLTVTSGTNTSGTWELVGSTAPLFFVEKYDSGYDIYTYMGGDVSPFSDSWDDSNRGTGANGAKCRADGGAVNCTANTSHISVYGVVPVPAAVWLFGSGLLGLVGVARRKRA